MKKYIKLLSFVLPLTFGLVATSAFAATSTPYAFELGAITADGTYTHPFSIDTGNSPAPNGGYNDAIYFQLPNSATVSFFSNSFTGTAIINEYILNYDNDPVNGFKPVGHWSGKDSVNLTNGLPTLLAPPVDVFLNAGRYQFKYESFFLALNGKEGTAGTFNGGIIVKGLAAPVPEPETYALMLAGLALVGFSARRRQA